MTEIMGQAVIWVSEQGQRFLVPWLLKFGAYSDPTDGCECLYLNVSETFRYVFHIFS